MDKLFWLLPRRLSSLRKLVWLRLSGAAAEIWRTITAAIATFTAVAAPLRQLSVSVEPVQNLNGYDNPWPAGGGKNKFGGEYGENFALFIPAGTTVTAYSDVGLAINYYKEDGTTRIDYWSVSASGRTFTIIEDAYYFKFSGASTTPTKLYIAIENSFSGYTPYSNICPITGWNSVTVNRTGKNLLPKMVAGTYTSSGITVVVDDTGAATVNISTGGAPEQLNVPLESGIVVTQAMVDGVYYHLNNTLVNPSVAPTLEAAQNLGVMAPTTGTLNRVVGIPDTAVGKTINRIRFWVGANITASGTYAPAFMLDSTATAYEPYNGNEYTIQLGDTVYGGTLDVLTGVLTVTHGTVSDFSNLTTNGQALSGAYRYRLDVSDCGSYNVGSCICSCLTYNASFHYANEGEFYNSLGALNIYLSDADIVSAKKTLADNNCFIVYPLATPQTIQLTPTEVSTLAGENYVWSDAGDVTVEYRAQ